MKKREFEKKNQSRLEKSRKGGRYIQKYNRESSTDYLSIPSTGDILDQQR